MIRYVGETVVLLHNTLYREIANEKQVDSYEYSSANSFYLFFMSTQGTQIMIRLSTQIMIIQGTQIMVRQSTQFMIWLSAHLIIRKQLQLAAC